MKLSTELVDYRALKLEAAGTPQLVFLLDYRLDNLGTVVRFQNTVKSSAPPPPSSYSVDTAILKGKVGVA